ncbi:MAG: energy transducer TonB [Planctomycetota bacterium]|nr:energy transducer TonB [Planctomycetota bacterium]
MRRRSRTDPLLVGFLASMLMHAGTGAVLSTVRVEREPATELRGGAEGLLEMAFVPPEAVPPDPPEPAPEPAPEPPEAPLIEPPPQPEAVKLGMAETGEARETWLGFEEYKEHFAEPSEVEQPALTLDPSSGPSGPELPSAATPPSPQGECSLASAPAGEPAAAQAAPEESRAAEEEEESVERVEARDAGPSASPPPPSDEVAILVGERPLPERDERAEAEPSEDESAESDETTLEVGPQQAEREGVEGAAEPEVIGAPAAGGASVAGADQPAAEMESGATPTLDGELRESERLESEVPPSEGESEAVEDQEGESTEPAPEEIGAAAPPLLATAPAAAQPLPPAPEVADLEVGPMPEAEVEEASEAAPSETSTAEVGDAASEAAPRAATPAAPGVPGPGASEAARPNSLPPAPAASGARELGLASDRESDATSIVSAPMRKLGQPLSGKGLEVLTRRPRFTHYSRLMGAARDPVFKILFRSDGTVEDVELVRSSGNPDIDRPLIDAMFQWRAKGEPLTKLKPGPPQETIAIEFRVLL